MMKLSFAILVVLITFSQAHSAVWRQKSSFGGQGRHRAVGISIYNKGYMGLGHVNGTGVDIGFKDWWQYDPASNSWSQKADYPVLNHGAVSFSIDKKGYVGGGSALNGEFFVYDPLLNTWQSIAPCPILPGDTQGMSIQGKGYVYQGDQLAEYNPASNSWTIKATAPVFFNSWSCSFASSGSGFIKSGSNFYEYKPSADQWLQKAFFPGQMSNGSSAFSLDDKGYITCGFVGSLSNVTNEVWEYNPGNNTWTLIEEFPGTKRRFPVAFAINGFGYFGTGTNGINLNDFWQFDPNNLGIDEGNMEITISTFPNPAVDVINVSLPESITLDDQDLKIQMISSNGKIHSTMNVVSKTFKIERNDLPAGVYILQLTNKERVLSNQRILFL